MKCRGKFIFKEIRLRDGGTFKSDKGENVNYPPAYILKLDENTDKGIQERTFKLAQNDVLVPEFFQFKPYTEIVLDFDIINSNNSIRLVPVAISSKDIK